MGWRDRLLNSKPETVGRAMKFGGGRILSQQDLPRAGMNKGGRAAKQIGGRANLLEEVGRIDAERMNPNRRAEKRRVIGELNRGYNKGGRVGLLHGGERGDKGPLQKIYEKIGRKWRGKEKTKVKGIEQDVKTGALTHKAPKSRWQTKPGRIQTGIMKGPALSPGQKLPSLHKPKNEQTYAQLKKKKKVRLKEEKRKKEFDKKHGVK